MVAGSLRVKRLAAYAAIYLLWGGSYLAVREVVRVVPPALAAGLRYTLAALILLPWSVIEGDALPTARELWNTVWTGLSLLVLGYGVVFWAETRLDSWIVAVLLSTTFLWTYLGECLVLRERRLQLTPLVAVVVGVGGMILLVGGSLRHDRLSFFAAVATLGCALSWSSASLALKRVQMPRSYIQIAGLQVAVAGFLFLVGAGSLEEWRVPPSAGLLLLKPIFGMLYLVLASSVVAFVAFHWLMQHEPASLVATATYVNPVVAMLLGIVAAHERCSRLQLMGAVAVIGSVVIIWSSQHAAGLRQDRA